MAVEHCAKGFREMGHRAEAKDVLIAKEKLQRAARRAKLHRAARLGKLKYPHLWWVGFWDWVLAVTVRYGQRPLTALWWLAAAAGLKDEVADRARGDSDLPSVAERDAVLHIVTIGVVLMLMIGMAQLMLPQFASERIGGPQGRWRSEAFGVALSVAVVLRAGGGYFGPDLPGESARWAMAVAGMLGLLAALAFALLLLRSARHHERLPARMQAGVPLTPHGAPRG